jgi:hypothetical protein
VTARQRTLEAAARRTVAALRKAGSLEDVDDLAIAGVLYSSHYLDHLDPLASPAHVASILRAHQAGLKLLLGRDGGAEDDGLAEVIAALNTPLGYAPLGDAPEDDGSWRRG